MNAHTTKLLIGLVVGLLLYHFYMQSQSKKVGGE